MTVRVSDRKTEKYEWYVPLLGIASSYVVLKIGFMWFTLAWHLDFFFEKFMVLHEYTTGTITLVLTVREA